MKSQSQFGEDIKISELFSKSKKGTYLDLGCFQRVMSTITKVSGGC